jgi:hypothetical protein
MKKYNKIYKHNYKTLPLDNLGLRKSGIRETYISGEA